MDKEQLVELRRLSVRSDGLRRAMEAVMNGNTPDHGKWGSFKNYASTYSILATRYNRIVPGQDLPVYDTQKMKGSMDTVWIVQKEIFDTVYALTMQLGALLSEYDTGTSASISELQDMLSANLRKAIFSKPEREVEVQNAIETLLIGRGYQRGIDYDREAGKIKFSGKEFIPDFVFTGIGMALEVKLIKDETQRSACIEQMSADIPAYLSVYAHVLFCVYDLGAIRDVSEFQDGIQRQAGVRICVIKH